MASTKLVLFTSKTLKNGAHPIMLRTIQNRKLKYFSTGYSCKPNQWDSTANVLLKSYPKSGKINHLLSKKKNELDDIIYDYENDKKNFTAEEVARKFRGTIEKKTLNKYLEEVIERLQRTGKVGNAGAYKDLLRTIKLFQKEKELFFSDITFLWLTKYEEDFLERGLAETSISIYMRTLRALFNRAIAEGFAKAEDYPFRAFKTSKYNLETRKRAITKEEMLKIINLKYDPEKSEWSMDSKNFFLFSFYCIGMNMIDMAFLRWSNIENGRIRYKRIKTGKEFDILIQPRAQELLNFYNKKNQTENDYIFPILNDEIHKTPQSQRDRIKKIRTRTNTDLKAIAKEIRIKNSDSITHYVARHSWATIQKKNGNSIAIISESMGHADEKTTKIYLECFENQVLDEANAKLI